jgi:hypothetical protein
MKRTLVAAMLVLSAALRLYLTESDRTCMALANAAGDTMAGMVMSTPDAQPTGCDARGAPCDQTPNAGACAAMAVCATSFVIATSFSVEPAPRTLQTVAPSSPPRPYSLSYPPEPPPPRA